MGYRLGNRQWERVVKWIAAGFLIVIAIYSIGQSENIYYVNGDYYLDHDPDVITHGVDPATGTITCDAGVGDFANCGTGKWPVYNELQILVRIVAFLSALIVVPYDFLKSKKNASKIFFAAIIGVLIPLPIPPILSFIEGNLVDAVQSANALKFVPVAILIGSLMASTGAIYKVISPICHGLKTTKKRRLY